MANLTNVYKCDICGNIVEVLNAGAGALVCCGHNMTEQVENTTDAAVEKHVPVVELSEEGIVVSVGSAEHPMTDDHYITWVEVLSSDYSYRINLKPGDKPKVCFPPLKGDIKVRAYCNLHGLWKA